MKIGLDISPLADTRKLSHRVRGTGTYIQQLKDGLETYYPHEQLICFSKGESIPQADIVHFPYFEPFFLMLPLQLPKRTLVTVHDLTPFVFPEEFPRGIKGEIKWWMQKRQLKKAARIITDSNVSKNDIMKFTGIAAENISVVYLAASSVYKKKTYTKTQIKAFYDRYNLPNKFVLYVGDVTWNKNIPRLVQAATSLSIPLVLIGKAFTEPGIDMTNSWNKDLVWVQDEVKKAKNIIVPGFVTQKDLVMFYNMATVFVMPSLYEGFGLPVLEAMNCGCPVITTKAGSLSEVAEEAAVYVDPYDITSIGKGIQAVYNSTALQESLQAKGIEQAKKFTWEKTVKATVDIYKAVV